MNTAEFFLWTLAIAGGLVVVGYLLLLLVWLADQKFAKTVAGIERQLHELDPKDLP